MRRPEFFNASFLMLGEDWEAERTEEDLPRAGSIFVVRLSGALPVTLGQVEGATTGPDLLRASEGGEELRTARVEVPPAESLEVYFGRLGAVVSTEGQHLFVPAIEPFESPADVRSALSSEGYRLLAAYEPLPGPKPPLTPRPPYEPRECPGPPRHMINVPRANPICPIHHLEAEPA